MGIVWSFNLSNCSREVGLLSCVLIFKHLYSLAPNYLYNDVTIVCSTVCSGADERKHKSSASLVFVRGIHRWPVVSPHKGLVTRKMFPFDDVIMINEAMVLCFGNYQFKQSNRVNWNPSHFVHSTVYTLYLLTWRIQSSAVLTRSNITRYNTQQCLIASEHKPDFELTTDIPYLALTGELCIYCQDLEENVGMVVEFKTGECEIKHDPGITRSILPNACTPKRQYLNVPTLRWRHNGRDSVSNHQLHDCLLNRSFRRRSQKTSKLRVTGLCVGNSPGIMFPFDDVIVKPPSSHHSSFGNL